MIASAAAPSSAMTEGNGELSAADVLLEDDGFDSDVEIIGAELFGVEMQGGRLAVTQAIELCRVLRVGLGPKLRVKEEEEADAEFAQEVGEAMQEVGNFVRLPQYERVASVRDLRYSHVGIRGYF